MKLNIRPIDPKKAILCLSKKKKPSHHRQTPFILENAIITFCEECVRVYEDCTHFHMGPGHLGPAAAIWYPAGEALHTTQPSVMCPVRPGVPAD